MLVDFNNIHVNTDRLPEVPYCRASDVLAHDGRGCADFNLLLSNTLENSSFPNAISGNGRTENHPLEILRQLL